MPSDGKDTRKTANVKRKERNKVNNRLYKGQTDKDEFSLFRGYINDICGIAIPPEKDYLIETRLTKLMLDAGVETFDRFYEYLVSNNDIHLRQKIINAITTNETLWFRDTMPWKVLENIYLPKLIKALISGEKKRVRIWCAAVSTGQEVYSTVMCVEDYLRKNKIQGISLSDFEFFATDISNRVLDIAKKGIYDKISIMRGLSEEQRTGYFKENNSAWFINPKIRSSVTFRQLNLKDSYRMLGIFDIIFCRYVLIYFSQELKREIISKMCGSLADDGILFTGNYVLYDLFEQDFDINHYEKSTYYSKRAVLI